MAADGEISVDDFSSKMPRYYRLPDVTALSKNHIPHEHLIAQLYVALELTGKLGTWEVPLEKDEFGLKPDAQCMYAGKVIFWEVDRGSEDYSIIKWKLDPYLQMSQAYREARFHVGFTTIDEYDRLGKLKRTAAARAKGILKIIDTYARADQFFVTTHDFAVRLPEYPSFSTFLNPMGVAIFDMK